MLFESHQIFAEYSNSRDQEQMSTTTDDNDNSWIIQDGRGEDSAKASIVTVEGN